MEDDEPRRITIRNIQLSAQQLLNSRDSIPNDESVSIVDPTMQCAAQEVCAEIKEFCKLEFQEAIRLQKLLEKYKTPEERVKHNLAIDLNRITTEVLEPKKTKTVVFKIHFNSMEQIKNFKLHSECELECTNGVDQFDSITDIQSEENNSNESDDEDSTEDSKTIVVSRGKNHLFAVYKMRKGEPFVKGIKNCNDSGIQLTLSPNLKLLVKLKKFERGYLKNIDPCPADRIMLRKVIDYVSETAEKSPYNWRNYIPQEKRINQDDPDYFQAVQGLNSLQQESIRKAISSKDFFVLHGPPGTGKTKVLVRLVKYCMTQNMRVSVVCQTHKALDNLLQACLDDDSFDDTLIKPKRVIRMGNPVKVTNTLWRFCLREILDAEIRHLEETIPEDYIDRNKIKKLLKKLITEAQVVFSTFVGLRVRSYPLNDLAEDLPPPKRFHICLVDEASLIASPVTLLCLPGCHKLVLAGDHHQLSPVLVGEEAQEESLKRALSRHSLAGWLHPEKRPKDEKDWYFKSLFERMILSEEKARNLAIQKSKPPPIPISVMLEVQYRMNEMIAMTSSTVYYKGLLKSGNRNKNIILADEYTTSSKIFDLTRPIVWVDHAIEETQESQKSLYDDSLNPQVKMICNPGEVKIVVAIVEDLFRNVGIPTSEIAIITPYNRQKELLLQALNSIDLDEDQIEISTIDSFQGREKQVVILGTTRCNKKGDVGFLRDERRFNVAMTRAKRLFILVGSSQTLAGGLDASQRLTKLYLKNVKKYGDHFVFDSKQNRFLNKDPSRDRDQALNKSLSQVSDTLESNSAVRPDASLGMRKKQAPAQLNVWESGPANTSVEPDLLSDSMLNTSTFLDAVFNKEDYREQKKKKEDQKLASLVPYYELNEEEKRDITQKFEKVAQEQRKAEAAKLRAAQKKSKQQTQMQIQQQQQEQVSAPSEVLESVLPWLGPEFADQVDDQKVLQALKNAGQDNPRLRQGLDQVEESQQRIKQAPHQNSGLNRNNRVVDQSSYLDSSLTDVLDELRPEQKWILNVFPEVYRQNRQLLFGIISYEHIFSQFKNTPLESWQQQPVLRSNAKLWPLLEKVITQELNSRPKRQQVQTQPVVQPLQRAGPVETRVAPAARVAVDSRGRNEALDDSVDRSVDQGMSMESSMDQSFQSTVFVPSVDNQNVEDFNFIKTNYPEATQEELVVLRKYSKYLAHKYKDLSIYKLLRRPKIGAHEELVVILKRIYKIRDDELNETLRTYNRGQDDSILSEPGNLLDNPQIVRHDPPANNCAAHYQQAGQPPVYRAPINNDAAPDLNVSTTSSNLTTISSNPFEDEDEGPAPTSILAQPQQADPFNVQQLQARPNPTYEQPRPAASLTNSNPFE